MIARRAGPSSGSEITSAERWIVEENGFDSMKTPPKEAITLH
jgi:hypothetical protein